MELLGKELVQCAQSFDLKGVSAILITHPPPEVLNFQNNGGNTALIQGSALTTETNSSKMVAMLLEAGVDVNLANKTGMTALMSASKKGYASVIKQLVDAGADIFAKNEEGQQAIDIAGSSFAITALKKAKEVWEAAERAKIVASAAETLLSQIINRDTEGCLSTCSQYSEYFEIFNYISDNALYRYLPPLMLAVEHTLADVVEKVLDGGALIDFTSQQDRSTSLIRCCRQKRLPSYPTTSRARQQEERRQKILNSLLSNKADTNMKDKDGNTALIVAASNGYDVDLRRLQANKANPDARNKFGVSALLAASRRGYTECVSALLQREEADVNITDNEGLTPLMWAAIGGFDAIASSLLDAGANRNITSHCDRTALWWAVEHRHHSTADLLLRNGADPNTRLPHSGTTPIIVASRQNDSEMVKILLSHGAQMNARNAEGMSALMWAAWTSRTALVEQLLEAGANPHLKDRGGFGALERARDIATKRIVKAECDRIYVEREDSTGSTA